MTDIEMTKLCAEAIGLAISDEDRFAESGLWCHERSQHGHYFRPLSGDTYGNAQAMALVKKFNLTLIYNGPRCAYGYWTATPDGVEGPETFDASDDDLNRAIVACVAKIRAQSPTLNGNPT